MQWPEPKNRIQIPEGHFSFRLSREPELRKFIDSRGQDNRRIIIYAIALGEHGEFPIVDSFVPWEPRYAVLCKALGVEHGRDIIMAGSLFEADIVHEPRKDKPGEFWPRIQNIMIPKTEEEPPLPEGEGPEGAEDVPF